NYGFVEINVFTLGYISLALLFLSVYFYALEYIKYGFKIFDRFALFKYFQVAAHTFYFIAILSPIIYVAMWGIVKLFLLIPISQLKSEKSIFVLSVGLFFSFLITGAIAAWKRYNEQRIAEVESLDESSVSAVKEADELIEKNRWNLSIIEAYRSIELGIKKKLLEIGINSKAVSSYRALEMLISNEVIDKNDLNKIQYVRQLRNQAAHSSVEFTKKEALQVIKTIKEILPKFETRIERAFFFEQKILDALVGKNGL
ncbi:unnamed protein product, partial [marine sediment metagenome]